MESLCGLHKEFCVEYDFSDFYFKDNIFKVIYSNERMITIMSEESWFLNSVLRKSKDWSYEIEWRLIIPTYMLENPHKD